MSDEAQDETPVTIPFHQPTESVDSTDEFEIEIPPSPIARTLDFRFFPKTRAMEANPNSSETRVVLPSGSILLVTFASRSSGLAARSFPG